MLIGKDHLCEKKQTLHVIVPVGTKSYYSCFSLVLYDTKYNDGDGNMSPFGNPMGVIWKSFEIPWKPEWGPTTITWESCWKYIVKHIVLSYFAL